MLRDAPQCEKCNECIQCTNISNSGSQSRFYLDVYPVCSCLFKNLSLQTRKERTSELSKSGTVAHSIECVAECYILRRGDPSGHLCRRYTMSNDRIAKPSAMMVGGESELNLVRIHLTRGESGTKQVQTFPWDLS